MNVKMKRYDKKREDGCNSCHKSVNITLIFR